MKKTLLILAVLIATGCGAGRKNRSDAEARSVHVEAGEKEHGPEPPAPNALPPETLSQIDAVVETALQYTGVRYKYGGTTRKGMDCSGLLYVSFLENDISLPRTSHLIAEEGKRIRLSDLQKGDLLFFKTRKGGNKINHAGLVVEVGEDDVKFIHSTTSRGVIVSSLREGYWNYAFVKATRVF